MADDIRTRLSEALDEAERQAKAATPGPWSMLANHSVVTDPDGELVVAACNGRQWWPTIPDGDHIARWSPSMALRLIEYFRRLIESHRAEPGGGNETPFCEGCDSLEYSAECPVLLSAAMVWLTPL